MTNIQGYAAYSSSYNATSTSYTKKSDGTESFKQEMTQAKSEAAAYYEKSDNSYTAASAYDKSFFGVAKNSVKQVSEKPELSDNAKKLLDELKDKYKDMDIIIDDFEEGKNYGGNKEYSLVISQEELERMANDEDVKKKDLELIDSSLAKLKEINENLTDEEKESITSLGVSINADGQAEFFAELTKLSDEQMARIQARRAEKKEEAEKAAKKEASEKAAKELEEKAVEKKDKETEKIEEQQKARVSAGSVEELLDKIRNYSWDTPADKSGAAINLLA